MLEIHDFTKLAVSRLIMVRFSKFEIWYAQHFDPVQPDVSDVLRDAMRARWRHARDDMTSRQNLTPFFAQETSVTSYHRYYHQPTSWRHYGRRVAALIVESWIIRSFINSDTQKGLKSPKMVRFWWSKRLGLLKKGCPTHWNAYFGDLMVRNDWSLPKTRNRVVAMETNIIRC